MKRKVRLSVLHVDVLRRVHRLKVVTPDRLAQSFNGRGPREHVVQQWAYLQLARLKNRGYLQRRSRGTYRLTTKGLREIGKL